ncbi:hypothetical protein CEXT_264021 [Caerostris extrusa]|uniref:Uncharacterized protein n=1 Tax=Caerostris extrusa TaxID=172846 RepID=A0AAV4M995_CAEEX|nr:hypothetical protein CEXT_264021 [Caerostris extrusa]
MSSNCPESCRVGGEHHPCQRANSLNLYSRRATARTSTSKYAQVTNDYSCPRLLHGAAILRIHVGNELPGALTIPCDIKITRAHLRHKEDTGLVGGEECIR